jgi:hypothetical protein
LFSLYEDGQPVRVHTRPVKIRLPTAIQEPGKYQVEVLVSARDAPSVLAAFIFEWTDFKNVSLTQVESAT